jgi:two-component system, NtrC family, sensor kinase
MPPALKGAACACNASRRTVLAQAAPFRAGGIQYHQQLPENMKYILLFLLPLALRAAPVALTDPTRDYDLFRASSVLEVQPGKVGIDALLKNPATYAFAPTRNELIKPNDRQKAYWFRVEVANPTQESFLLHFVYSGTERIEVYEVAEGQIVNQRTFGRLVPEQEHHFRYSKLFVPILARQSDRPHTLYIYMAGLYNASPYFHAHPTVNLLEIIHREDLFYGLYYGFILIISIYSLFLFFRLRDQDTLRYAVWVLFVGLQLGLYRGFTTEFLWPGNHEFEQYSSALAGITGLLHVLFTLSFLRLKKYQPTFYRLGQVMIGAYILGIVLFLGSAYVGGATGRIIDVIPVLGFGLIGRVSGHRSTTSLGIWSFLLRSLCFCNMPMAVSLTRSGPTTAFRLAPGLRYCCSQWPLCTK